jgi:hypothetical protein
MAELAIEKLNQKRNLLNLHAILTMDILLYDKFGQLSAKLIKSLDIILRKTRRTSTSFGGVLVVANMDVAQLGPIHGLPILLSSHILTDFVIVGLTESVRAHRDPEFCEIQNITCMSPFRLKGNVKLEAKFKRLCQSCFTYVHNWDEVPHDVTPMYARRKPAQEALNEYLNSYQVQFNNSGTQYIICHAVDSQGSLGSRAEMVQAIPNSPIVHYLDGKLREPQN